MVYVFFSVAVWLPTSPVQLRQSASPSAVWLPTGPLHLRQSVNRTAVWLPTVTLHLRQSVSRTAVWCWGDRQSVSRTHNVSQENAMPANSIYNTNRRRHQDLRHPFSDHAVCMFVPGRRSNRRTHAADCQSEVNRLLCKQSSSARTFVTEIICVCFPQHPCLQH